MKPWLTFLGVLTFSATLFFLCGAFVEASLNPALWDMSTRTGVVFATVLLGIPSGIVVAGELV